MKELWSLYKSTNENRKHEQQKKRKRILFLVVHLFVERCDCTKISNENRFKKKKKRYITIMRKVNKMCGHGKYCDQKNNQIII